MPPSTPTPEPVARPVRGRGHSAGLTQEALVTAATAVLRVGGVRALTMRAVAAHLGVTASALYAHVRDKTELVDLLLDDALAAAGPPDPATSHPRADLEALMTSMYDALVDRRDLLPLYLARRGSRGVQAHRLRDTARDLLVAAEVAPERLQPALDVLVVHVMGAAALAGSPPAAAVDGPERDDAERVETERGMRAAYRTGLRWTLDGAGLSGGGAPPDAPAG